jgi:hypothetical protein
MRRLFLARAWHRPAQRSMPGPDRLALPPDGFFLETTDAGARSRPTRSSRERIACRQTLACLSSGLCVMGFSSAFQAIRGVRGVFANVVINRPIAAMVELA